jgi:hypothetical protein
MQSLFHKARTVAGAAWLVSLVSGSFGCKHHVKHDTMVHHAEEFHSAPSEDRYNNPPELGYRKPPPKKEFKPSFGAGGGGGGPAGMGGMQ